MNIYYRDFPLIDIRECSCKKGFFDFFSNDSRKASRKDSKNPNEIEMTFGGANKKRRKSKRNRTSKFLEIPLLYNKKKTLKKY